MTQEDTKLANLKLDKEPFEDFKADTEDKIDRNFAEHGKSIAEVEADLPPSPRR